MVPHWAWIGEKLSFDDSNSVTISDSKVNKDANESQTLTDIFVCKLMCETYPLWLMFHRLSVHYRMLELFHNGFVDSITLCHT